MLEAFGFGFTSECTLSSDFCGSSILWSKKDVMVAFNGVFF